MKIVFVIGAARSGTHLVGSSINKVVGDSYYLAEINEFWNKYNSSKIDSFDLSKLTEEKLEKLRFDFLCLAPKSSSLIIEKTASNSLRVDLLAKLFPEAYFINIVRNGNDVVESVVRKIEGNPNKITAIGQKRKVGFFERVAFYCHRSKEKIFSSTFDFKYFICNFSKYALQSFDILGFKKTKKWGPIFSEEEYDNPIAFAAAQWSSCVTKSHNDFVGSGVKYLTVKFESIVSHPEVESERISSFLEIDHNINWFDIKDGIRSEANMVYGDVSIEFKSAMNRLGYFCE
ncbi:hypothetical protein JCM19233_3361 [Vibrio astriarenae]|nr:hypothetical protein JCM19233_3361 [Vibrio sp. C7]